MEAIDPEACYASWDAILSTDKGLDAVRDVFIFVKDQCELSIDELGEAEDEEGHTKRLGEVLNEQDTMQLMFRPSFSTAQNVSAERFVMPLSCVEACVELEEQEGLAEDGFALIHYRGYLIPIVAMRRSFAVYQTSYARKPPAEAPARAGHRRL